MGEPMDYRAELLRLCKALEDGNSDAYEEAEDILLALRSEPGHTEED